MSILRKSFILYGFYISAFVFLLSSGLHADPLDNWHWRNPLPQGNTLLGAGYGNGIYLAVGFRGTIIVSPDGTNWSVRDSGTVRELNAVAFGNGSFVAAGEEGTIVTSDDGETWTERSSGTNLPILEIAFGGGIFAAVASGGWGSTGNVLLTSVNGIEWTAGVSGISHQLFGVTYGNGRFVVVGANVTFTSSNGVDWESHQTDHFFASVTYGNGLFVAISANGILTSSDGISWKQVSAENNFSKIIFGGGLFVGVHWAGSFITSPDGETWTRGEHGYSVFGIGYGGGIFVGVGMGGTILTSADAIHWVQRQSGMVDGLYEVTCAKGTCVAVGDGGTLTSRDGVTWTRKPGFGGLGVTYGNGMFLSVGYNTIRLSSDGLTWSEVAVEGTLRAAAYGKGVFVAVGDYGNILTSYGGQTWTKRDSGTTYDLYSVAYGNGVFVAGGRGVVLTSPDGVTWRESPPSGDALGVTFGNGIFVRVSYDGIFTSSDGIAWTMRGYFGSYWFHSVAYGEGAYTAVGSYTGSRSDCGSIFTSSDTIEWTERRSSSVPNLSGVAYGNGTFIAVGGNGAILQSDPVGTSPQISVNAASVEFEAVRAGDVSTVQPLTIMNLGTVDLHISSMEFTGIHPTEFKKDSDSCSGFPIPPSGSCTVNLAFSPSSKGMKDASFSILSDDPDTPRFDIPLKGRGYYFFLVDPEEGTVGSEITVTGADFGSAPGRLLSGGSRLEILEWRSGQIKGLLTKPVVSGVYNVAVQPAGGPAIVEEGGFSVRPPGNLSFHDFGTAGDLFSVQGSFFGSMKSKVSVGGKSCRVREWGMNPTTGESWIECVLPRLLPGEYSVAVSNRVGKATGVKRVRIGLP